jgi:hypothetical protein
MVQRDRDPGRAELQGMSLLHGRIPDGFELRMWVVEPGATVPYDDAEWAGSLVTVEDGEIELRCDQGGSRRFGRGSMLALEGLGLVAFHGCGPEPTVLAAISRRVDPRRSAGPEPVDLAVDGAGGPDDVTGGEQVEQVEEGSP